MEDRKLKQLQIKMTHPSQHSITRPITSFKEFIQRTNYSLIDKEHILTRINQIIAMVSGNLPNIYLLHGEMTDDEMNQLNNDNKICSLSIKE